jgi:uncharacterized protein YqiB (DUF1249 family)
MSRGKQQYLERSAKRALKADLPHEQLRAMLEDLAELKELKVQEVQEVSINLEVVEHKCGFSELIATVNSLESEIKGLCLEDKCGVLQTDW